MKPKPSKNSIRKFKRYGKCQIIPPEDAEEQKEARMAAAWEQFERYKKREITFEEMISSRGAGGAIYVINVDMNGIREYLEAGYATRL